MIESDFFFSFVLVSGIKHANLRLVVEQVKIVDEEGGLKVLYPSRTDLHEDGFDVIRNWNQDG